VRRKVFIAIILLLLLPVKVFAATITSSITNSNSNYQVGDEVQIHASIDINTSDGTVYYLRGVFYKSGTSNYCGYTWNGSAFYNSPISDGKNFLKVTVNNNKWEGDLKAKIDSQNSDCNASGEYKFKIQRFTDSGSGSFDDQSELTANFTIPSPTPTSTPHPTNTPTPTNSPTNTPTPTVTMTPAPTVGTTPVPTVKTLVSPSISPQLMSAQNTNARQQAVQGAQNTDKSGGIDLGGKLSDLDGKESPYNWGKLLILMGAVLVTGACGILVYNNYTKEKAEEV
jgi:hypothetical protein